MSTAGLPHRAPAGILGPVHPGSHSPVSSPPSLLAPALAALVALAPWPYGSVAPGSALALRWTLLALFAYWLLASREGEARAAWGPLSVAGVGAAALLACLPWPGLLVSGINPVAGKANLLLPSPAAWLPASTASAATLAAALSWLAIASALVLARAVGRTRRRSQVLAVIALVAFAQALPALPSRLGIHLGGWADLSSRYSGSLVNANHFALFLVLAGAVAGAAGCAFVASRDRPSPLLLLGAAIVVAAVVAGILASGSRSGLLALGTVFLAQGVVALWSFARRRPPSLRLLLPPLVALVLIAGLWIRGPVVESLAESTATQDLGPGFAPGRPYQENAQGREQVTGATIELWRRAPIFGTGAGTFRQTFPVVRPPGSRNDYWHAHNDYAELLATTGLVGAALVAAALFFLLGELRHGLGPRRSGATNLVCLAACGALAGAGVQSYFDFGLVIPSNALILATLCGLALGSATRTRADAREGRTSGRSGRGTVLPHRP